MNEQRCKRGYVQRGAKCVPDLSPDEFSYLEEAMLGRNRGQDPNLRPLIDKGFVYEDLERDVVLATNDGIEAMRDMRLCPLPPTPDKLHSEGRVIAEGKVNTYEYKGRNYYVIDGVVHERK